MVYPLRMDQIISEHSSSEPRAVSLEAKLKKLKKLKTAYSYFKPYMIEQIVKIRKNISLRGRRVEMSYDKFLDALFFVVDEGSRYRTSNLFGIPKSTFTRHVKYLSDHNILEVIYLSFARGSLIS